MRKIMATAGAALLASCGGPAADGQTSRAGEAAAASLNPQRLFGQCAVCHTTAPPDTAAGKIRLVGPNLFGVYGANSAHIEGFAYSKAMRETNLVWDDATLDAWIANPQKLVPNNRMAYAGEPDPAKRAAMIEYLKTLR